MTPLQRYITWPDDDLHPHMGQWAQKSALALIFCITSWCTLWLYVDLTCSTYCVWHEEEWNRLIPWSTALWHQFYLSSKGLWHFMTQTVDLVIIVPWFSCFYVVSFFFCFTISSMHRVFYFEIDWMLCAAPVSEFLCGSTCSVQLDGSSVKNRLAAYFKIRNRVWDTSETHCGTSGGITSMVKSGCNQLWQPRHSWKMTHQAIKAKDIRLIINEDRKKTAIIHI